MLRTLTRLCLHRPYPTASIHFTPLKLAASPAETVPSASATDDDVKFQRINKTGIIQLNKPKTLNALSLPMIRRIYPKMKEWESDGQTKLVIIKGAGSKAFCAGGDIKALLAKTSDGEKVRQEFFREEYRLNNLIGTYKLPYIALIHGITMGGGCGLSVHGPFRVATETTTIAMPETAIGLFPDVGGSYFLSRLPNHLGVFLGLTGHRLRGADVVHAGFATHFIQSNRLEEIERKLVEANQDSIRTVLDKNSESVETQSSFSLQSHLPLINRIFSLKTQNVETILEQLKSDGSEFALKQHAILEKMSPTSLKLTFEELKRGKELNLQECLKMEYRIGQRLMKDHDFFEGVRAVLVDKDNKPRWQPSSLSEVSDREIARYFEKLPSNEELQLP